MGSSFCDPTRQVCPFGAQIDPTLSLVNNVYVRAASAPPAVPGVVGPLAPVAPTTMPTTIRSAPNAFLPFGNDFSLPSFPPVTIPISFGQAPGPVPTIPTRTPPLLPGRIPPGPSVFPQQAGCGCGSTKCSTRGVFIPVQNGCCPKGCHPDKRTGTKCVSNRRMNPLNPRALRRSLRRIDQFENFVNRTAKLTGLRLAKKSTRRK